MAAKKKVEPSLDDLAQVCADYIRLRDELRASKEEVAPGYVLDQANFLVERMRELIAERKAVHDG